MNPGLTIVLLGNSGVGKSASGNTILGRQAFVSKRSFKQVTTKISDPENETVFSKRIAVIDTPGIFGSERDVQRCCQEVLQSSTPCLFLVVIKIDRFTTEQMNAIEAAIRVIGGDKLRHSYLLFTGGDVLDNELEDFINEDPDGALGRYVEMFGGHHVFNNENGGQGQVRELLLKSGHLEDAAADLPERRIVLLGLPGYGKSASGNTILGSKKFKSESNFNAVTTQTVSASAMVDGRRVTVVDTPGFTPGQVLSPRKLFYEIMKSIAEASPGPHAFIIVVKIDRISEADVILYEMLPKLFGRDAHKYVMILFTYGDQLGDQNIEKLIRSHKCVERLVSEFRYSVFNNTKRGDRVQVKDLLGKIDVMVTANNGEHYNSEMFYDVQPLDVQPLDVQPLDVQPLDVQPLDVLPLDVQPLDVLPLDVQPLDCPSLWEKFVVRVKALWQELQEWFKEMICILVKFLSKDRQCYARVV